MPSDLNPAQEQAVNTLSGPVMILAGAGTGKTRTVTYRIANLIRTGTPAQNLLAVTFTNKAAAEMKERIASLISKKSAQLITVCTFHSLCVRILRQHIDILGFKNNFSIISGSDQSGLIRELIVQKGGAKEQLKPAEVLSQISRAKVQNHPLADIQDPLIADIAVTYQNELRSQNALDFDDLLLMAERLLREHSSVRKSCQQQWTHITVDEFQDTNQQQMALLQQLVAPPYHLCVVGDDDQSIYGWRGAEIANILNFEQHFKNPTIIKLEHNYRSTEAILQTANQLILNNLGRREKQLRHTIQGGSPIRLISMPGHTEEAEFISEEILELKKSEQRPFEHFAILFRTKTQIRIFESTLRELKIPYRLLGAQSFYDRKEVKDILAYLHLLNDPFSDLHLLRILNTPPRGIGQKTAVLAVDHSRTKKQSVWETLGDSDFLSPLGQKTKHSIAHFIERTLYYRDLLIEKKQNAGTLLQAWLDELDYDSYLSRLSKTERERDQKREATHELISSLTQASSKGMALQRFLDQIALSSEKNEDDLEKQKGVSLITLHASKGLEFPYVYLPGLEQGILPHQRSVLEGTLDEERRLFYVGITRAQEQLTLSYCSQRIKWGEPSHCEPSVFQEEILENNEFIEVTHYDEIMNAEASDEAIANLFASLKS